MERAKPYTYKSKVYRRNDTATIKASLRGLTSRTFGGREFKGKYLHAQKSYFGKSKAAAFLKRMVENHYVTIVGSRRGTKYRL